RAYAGLGQKELAQESFAEAARLNPEFAAEAEMEIAKLQPPPAPPKPATAKPVTQKTAAPVAAKPRANAPAKKPAARTPAPKPPKLAPLKRKVGYAIGRCVNMAGKPLANVRIRVFGVAKNGNNVNFETRTNAAGAYSVQLPAGMYHVGWAL